MNMFSRLDQLRRRKGWTWNELASALGISRTMLFLLKNEKRPISVKLEYRLRELEGDRDIKPTGKGGAVAPYLASDPSLRWMHSVRTRWQKSPASRDEITMAVRVLFPKYTAEILEWMRKR